jgi:hypothetical protein
MLESRLPQRTDLSERLALAERLLWGNDDRAKLGKSLVPDPFLAGIELRLCLPRALLECVRADLGLSADLAVARSAMATDVEANGDGRKIYYPAKLMN